MRTLARFLCCIAGLAPVHGCTWEECTGEHYCRVPDDSGLDGSLDGASDAGAGDASFDAGQPDADTASFSAEAMIAALGSCERIGGDYATDSGEDENIAVCQREGVVWWTSDMDIDCDGGRETSCTSDPTYLPETSATDPSGEPIDANTVPFIVIPSPSSRFRYAEHGIALGQYALVIYQGHYAFASFADTGPAAIIGEGSYALAEELDIDPNPVSGGADEGVTFVVFTGTSNRTDDITDLAQTNDAVLALAQAFVAAR